MILLFFAFLPFSALGSYRFNESMIFNFSSVRSAQDQKASQLVVGFDASLSKTLSSFLAFETGIAYLPKKFTLNQQLVKFAVFQFPLLLRVRLPCFHAATGFFFNRRIGEIDSLSTSTSQWKRFDMGIVFAAGFDQRVFEMLYLVSEVRANAGLTNQSKSPTHSVKSWDIQLRIGLGYDF
jgi:hypothetical protein